MLSLRAAADLQEAIALRPRLRLASLPTPLDEAPRLSARLGLRVLLKRDDQTGLALGGNKARKLEFLVAEARALGADVVVTTGGSQSNHARITAAACRRAGLDCHLVLDRGIHPEQQGNLLLDELLGAHVHWLDSQDPAEATARMEVVAQELRAAGRRPHLIPRGGSVPAGAIGYAAFVPELLEQLGAMGLEPTHLYLCTGSTGTHSGVLTGLTAVGAGMTLPMTLQGISVSRDSAQQSSKVRDLTNRTLETLGLGVRIGQEDVRVDDAYRGPGYGIPTAATMEAIRIVAMDEGVILDPVYTGKGMAGLIDHARSDRLGPDDVVIFLHTGGSPALFAYHQELGDF